MLVKNITVRDGDCYLIPGDCHFDKQDNAALTVMLGVALDRGINGAILVGDTFNSAGISRHGRPPKSFRFGQGTIKAEEAAARPWITAIKEIVLSNRKEDGGLYCLTGNHEHWWAAVQSDYPGLINTPWHELYGDLFDDYHVFEETDALKLGHLLVCHGHRLRGALAKYSAASVLSNYPGQNTLYGHTHRVDSCITPSFKYGNRVSHGAWTIGHMCDPVEELKHSFLGPLSEKHTQGFALVTFHDIKGDVRFNVEQVVIQRDDSNNPFAVSGGNVYRVDSYK